MLRLIRTTCLAVKARKTALYEAAGFSHMFQKSSMTTARQEIKQMDCETLPSLQELNERVNKLEENSKLRQRQIRALQKGAPDMIINTCGDLLLHCIGVQPKPHESMYFEQERAMNPKIATKVSIATRFLPQHLKLADFDEIINQKKSVEKCMNLFKMYPDLVFDFTPEYDILSTYNALHENGIV